MKTAYLLLLIFACAFTNNANAQVGYIITKNDTIKGEMKVPAFGRPKFKPANSAAFVSLNLDTIQEYQLTKDSSVWVVRVFPASSANMNFIGKFIFLQRLEHGKINLYQQVANNREHLTTWYVSKTTDSLIAIKTDDLFLLGGGSKNSRKEALINMMSEQPAIQTAFKAENKFSYENIRLYIRRYNASMAQGK